MIALLLYLVIAPAAPATNESIAAGLKLKLESGKLSDARIARLAAIAVPERTFSSALLDSGPFIATFDGFINLKLRGDYVFSIEGRGDCELQINGQSVLSVSGEDLSIKQSDKIRLKKGPNSLLLHYTAPASGDAAVRLFWSEKGQPPEPISPLLFTHDSDDVRLRQSMQLRRGRALLSELRCAKCHRTENAAPDAPSLTEIGSRLNADWMAKWIDDPKSIRADASMPRVFRSDADARDVAAFLATLKAAEKAVEFKPDDLAIGAHLFTGLGCVVCHTESSLPLSYVPAKWKPAALKEYLDEPGRRYEWTRMPDFKLSEDEARQLARYLLIEAPVRSNPVAGDSARGRALVATSGCLNCHTLEPERSKLVARPLAEIADVDRGCLGRSDSAPEFALSAEDRAAIGALIRHGVASQARPSPIDSAEEQIRALNCIACHTRDSQNDSWSSLRKEIDAINLMFPRQRDVLPMSGDQSRPSLTWLGEKLRTDWIRKFIVGEIDYKPRPWLAARMPAFGSARARVIADGMPLEHGILPRDDPQTPLDAQQISIGRKLVGRNGGFGCNACHGVGTTPPTSAFEAQGVNFARVSERMRPAFYRRWMRDPQHFEPGTRMPQYSDAHGKTALKEFFDGDAEKQFHAIWRYLESGEKMEPPD